MVISEVFRDPQPGAPTAGPAMLLESLQAGISAQLAVLDDPALTGTGHSSAELLGVTGTALAGRLATHLVREIITRGSAGGPLAPLASQLNHELTRLQGHQQGQRIEETLARLAADVRAALNPPPATVTTAGRPLEEVTDPFALEVHQPVQLQDAPPGLPDLPAYVPRDHDRQLARAARAAADGRSAIAVLVGGSSTGKTRACWQALQLLREQPGGWRLWHPIDPGRPEAALRELPAIRPRTVIWLNEAQLYLDPPGDIGEQVAAGLRELLRTPARAPVLVLATLWPQHWDVLTTRPVAGPDQHAHARELLAGHDITVPGTFTPAQLQQLTAAGDPRLTRAAQAEDGQATQYLAGAPLLLARYRNAPPAAAALINAAIDARRLGAGIALPVAFLDAAAPGYLTGAQWDALPGDWLEQALAYTAAPCNGTRGPLTPTRGAPGTIPPPAPAYRLADYLEQHGRREHHARIPPASFWDAALAHVRDPADTARLAGSARNRLLYRYATPLYRHATDAGDADAAMYLADLLAERGNLDEAAQILRTLADAGDAVAAQRLADLLAQRGNLDEAAQVLGARADTGDTVAAAQLAQLLIERGDLDELRARADTGDTVAAAWLAQLLARRGDLDGLRGRVDAGDVSAASPLASLLISQGRGEEAERLRRFGLNPDGSIASA